MVAQFASGVVLRNLGCRISEGRKWCEVARAEDPSVRGWVAGAYLREAAYPGAAGVAAEDALVPGTDFNATGEVPCARHAGQPMTPCRFGVLREGNGSGLVTVFWPHGGSRVILFEDGAAIGSDASEADGGGAFEAKRESDLTLIRIDEERYEIPDAVIDGG